MTGVNEVQVVAAHQERATLRVGDMFLKVDADQVRADIEVAAMTSAPIPTPRILWRNPPVLALGALPGAPLGCLGQPSTASRAAWTAAGATVRTLHDAPLPPAPGRSPEQTAALLDSECAWILEREILPAELVARNRRIAESALRPWKPVFIHGDLHIENDTVTGVIDWSEAASGDAHFDLATLTLGHRSHLEDVLSGYAIPVDRTRIHAWWSLRSLLGIRWLIEHGFDPATPGCEVDVLKVQAGWGDSGRGGVRG
ncbi:aminoglycoside phosphotransferase family protein [Nocardia sp. 2]|uniref:Aminoglycoside phosphotransferase family protein n=1 Tax=Nocardia acididurans TaxID=2802282 RepID=A0ABS1LZ15_9NOCA|nr:aminoglycoside phosphotransferase family protein [Nocardia acididurans]MBL1073662.1 aminoglycoside phosphotransferase family protein [Nocardia acididurans]